jgi:hypothetical protein
MSKQPYALWLADRFDDVGDWYEFDAKTWVPGAAAELRRLHSVNAELLAALQAMYRAAPMSTECGDFHHGASDRHDFGGECKPLAAYRDAAAQARAAIALATPAPSTQPEKD